MSSDAKGIRVIDLPSSQQGFDSDQQLRRSYFDDVVVVSEGRMGGCDQKSGTVHRPSDHGASNCRRFRRLNARAIRMIPNTRA
jgi:hypothetical protein